MKKRCTAFLLTDFMDLVPGAGGTRFEEGLKIASSRHDLVGLRIYDVRETALPDVGIVEMQDAETGRKVWVDTASRRTRDSYAAYWELASAAIARTLTKCRVDTVSVATGEDYVAALLRLFKMR